MKKILVVLCVLAVMLLSACGGNITAETKETLKATVQETTEETVRETTEDAGSLDGLEALKKTDPGKAQQITMTLQNGKIVPARIYVQKGKVKLVMTSLDETHTFVLADFGIEEEVKPGDIVVVEFEAEEEGTYTFTAAGEKGEITVQ